MYRQPLRAGNEVLRELSGACCLLWDQVKTDGGRQKVFLKRRLLFCNQLIWLLESVRISLKAWRNSFCWRPQILNLSDLVLSPTHKTIISEERLFTIKRYFTNNLCVIMVLWIIRIWEAWMMIKCESCFFRAKASLIAWNVPEYYTRKILLSINVIIARRVRLFGKALCLKTGGFLCKRELNYYGC